MKDIKYTVYILEVPISRAKNVRIDIQDDCILSGYGATTSDFIRQNKGFSFNMTFKNKFDEAQILQKLQEIKIRLRKIAVKIEFKRGMNDEKTG